MNPIVVAFFIAFILLALAITYWAGRKNVSVSSHYVAGKQIKGWQNGLAIAGDFISAASVLGVTGAFALSGFYGFHLNIGTIIAFVVALLVVAEPLRKLGRYTIADVLTTRFNSKPIRAVAAVNTIIINLVYMVVQFVGAGIVVSLLLGLDFSVAVIITAVLMTVYSMWGGMLATTWIQITQMMLLSVGLIVILVLTLAQFNFNPLSVFSETVDMYGIEAIAPPSLELVGKLDILSLTIGLALGIAGLPHIMVRLLTVPDSRAIRGSLITSVWTFCIVYGLLPIIGFGAAVIIGRAAIAEGGPGGNLAVPELAQALGGDVFLAFIAAVIFIVIVATLTGINISASGTFGHDIYANLIRGGQADEREQHRVARAAGVLFAIVALLIALGAQNFNLAFLANVAFAIAASANFPTLVLTFYWKKFNMTGAFSGMAGGLLSAVLLVLISPNVMGENAIFPLTIPALVSVPFGFLACYVGTLVGKRREDATENEEKFEQVYVRANT